ncbi:MAG: NAD(P)H-hydrate epimerase [Bacteroidota bacterium]|nr:NAD(P)H-hydrate epimerase [Bacteroidota bacterium]
MEFPEINIADIATLPIEKFREMDYLAVEKYHLPIELMMVNAIREANQLPCLKISLDLPSGFDRQTSTSLFMPDIILTLAAMKTELLPLVSEVQLFVADLGIPLSAYNAFGTSIPEVFRTSSLIFFFN